MWRNVAKGSTAQTQASETRPAFQAFLPNTPTHSQIGADKIEGQEMRMVPRPFGAPIPDVTRDGGDYIPGMAWPSEQTPEPQPVRDVREHQDAHTYMVVGPDGLKKILKERGERYGTFAHNASISQQLKLTFRRHPFAAWDSLTEDQQEVLDQIAAKISRLLVGDPTYVDNWDDIAGFATLVADRLRADR